MENEIKLNLGSGGRSLPGYLSVDFNREEQDKIDVVHDMNKPLPFEDGSVSTIFASHIIEHFHYTDTAKILNDWSRVIKPGGHIDIWTVDLDVVMKRSKENTTSAMNWVNWRIFSYQDSRYEGASHHAIFNRWWLEECMRNAGFKNFEAIPIEEFPFAAHQDMNMGVRGYR